MLVLVGLFFGAFLAATVLPFSSEVMLATAVRAGEIPVWLLISVAALGNILGAVVNWVFGRFLFRFRERRWFPFSPDQLEKASDRFRRFGVWSLLLSWVPIIGDPLTFAAGVLNVRFAVFVVLVAIGKTARYVAVGLAF
ncbi:MAG: YqaA family protein [Pseudomonadota bacterium]